MTQPGCLRLRKACLAQGREAGGTAHSAAQEPVGRRPESGLMRLSGAIGFAPEVPM